MVKMSQNFKFISVVDTKLLTIANVRFYHFQAFICVLRRVRNFVVISGTKESLRDGERSVLTVLANNTQCNLNKFNQ